MSCYFELDDVPGYQTRFPALVNAVQIGKGEYSMVYQGSTPDTVLKLTCDHVYVEFITANAGKNGLPAFVKNLGQMDTRDHGIVYLLEMPKLQVLSYDLHESMALERDALIAAVNYRLAVSERFNGIIDCQHCHAGAMQELSLCKMFSVKIREALLAIAKFLFSTHHDVLLDLCNPANYMTDGTDLIITDPLCPVN